MLLHCLKCRKNTESKNPKVVKTKNGRIILLSKFALRDSKKSRFIKEQETSGLTFKSNFFSRPSFILGVFASQYKI